MCELINECIFINTYVTKIKTKKTKNRANCCHTLRRFSEEQKRGTMKKKKKRRRETWAVEWFLPVRTIDVHSAYLLVNTYVHK